MFPLFVVMAIGPEIRDYMLRLYMDLGSHMMHAALKRLKDPELAKDAVQTAMMKLCKSAETLMRLEEPMRRIHLSSGQNGVHGLRSAGGAAARREISGGIDRRRSLEGSAGSGFSGGRGEQG